MKKPRWWRRLFPGRWTAAEVADIERRAAERYERIKGNIE